MKFEGLLTFSFFLFFNIAISVSFQSAPKLKWIFLLALTEDLLIFSMYAMYYIPF